ncbi:MAG: ABC transporter ATP-binding protein [Chloroflexota bacterium]|nr:ABC transporter ATP-binding protein [Chloroflexota bacterium]
MTGLAQSSSDTDEAIRLRDVIKVYRDGDVETIALRGVDLSIKRGEFVAVMGRSGSGKTTLLNLLAGADRPTAGQVMIDGTALDRADEGRRQKLRGRSVGIVFQTQNLVPFLTLAENVQLVDSLATGGTSGATEDELLARVGLRDRAGHRPDALSGGEQQRAALACVLAANPAVLLADEITGELDSVSAAALMDLVRAAHRERGMTVVLVTHDPAVAQSAQRIVRLADGRIVDDRLTDTAA